MLNNFLEGLRDAEIRRFFLNEMRFLPCQECENIRKDGKCKIEDDMQKLYPEIENADLVVVASPVFFGSVSAQIKMMIDRFQCQWLAINIFKTFIPKKKKGLFLCLSSCSLFNQSKKMLFISSAHKLYFLYLSTVTLL